jgi:outer membrane protein OmpA-like peptidoglycan-associated protein
MKKPVCCILGLYLIVHFTLPVFGQLGNDPRSYYVVIGAFAIKKNAVNFTRNASETYDAKFEFNPARKLDYVYIRKTSDKQSAVEEAMRLRTSTRYDDTWVYYGALGSQADLSIQGQDINPATELRMSEVALMDNTGKTEEVQESSPMISETPEVDQEPEDPRARNFIFKVSRIDTKASIEGSVDAIDTEKARKIGTYDANKNVKVSAPANLSGGVSFICEVFGYRKVQKDISNYSDPEGEGITNENGATVVPFELMRLQKGDIATMFHVYFFKDAAVMRPESRYEVNSLVEMMNENPKYKIRIHGHTNGNAAGKITTMDKGSDNYFSLSSTSDGFGSAKKLSQMRAEMMRDYLVSNGIDHKRLQVKAWGGKKPIFDKLHSQAQANVRVEIEILDN